MIKLIFVLLDDIKSKNTINILQFLNEYINVLNKKKYFIEILPINKKIIETNNFKKFRDANNLQSIPSVIIMTDKGINTISNANNVASFLENIIKQPTQSIPQNNIYSDYNDNESINSIDDIQNYMTNEICDKNFDKTEDILSTGHADNTLIEKMKNFNSKKGKNIESNSHNYQSINNNITSNNKLYSNPANNEEKDISDDMYSEKLFNKAEKKKNIKNMIKNELNNSSNSDDHLISNKFLDDLDND